MEVTLTAPLFAWDELEESPTIRTLREFLKTLPDEKLLRGLRYNRGKGRNDYPVHVLWGTLVMTIALRHASIDGCLAELNRNEALRRVIGIESEGDVPHAWNMSRFLAVLGEEPHRSHLREIFNEMVRRLSTVVPDLGRETAGDTTALSARKDRAKGPQGVDGLPEPADGHKEYRDESGNVTKMVKWFGYKLHLLVDVRHEVALACEISSTKVADTKGVEGLVRQAEKNLPPQRIKTLAYDKAADDGAVHELLDTCGIKPVIQNRCMWKGDPEQLLPGHNGNSNITYDEAGTIYCYDKTSSPPVRRRMAYLGHEAARKTLKYRCPARHAGWKCPSDALCNGGTTYGKTVRVPQSIDLRRFPSIPRSTKKFKRAYNGRTAVERVNARLKVFWGIDDGNITGAKRFHAYVGTVMVVHLAFATLLAAAPRKGRTLGGTRLGPLAKALREKIGL